MSKITDFVFFLWDLCGTPQDPPKVKYFFIVASVYLHFKVSTPSQSEIFFIIVASSVYLHFKTSAPSQSEIFFEIGLKKYFTLGGCTGLERPIYKSITAFQKIFHFGRVLWSWKASTYIQVERTINRIPLKKISHFQRVNYNNKKYFTLGGCFQQNSFEKNISLCEHVLVLKGQYIHMSRENKQQNTFEKNISLWDGVLVLKGQYTQQTTITKNISLWEGVLVF